MWDGIKLGATLDHYLPVLGRSAARLPRLAAFHFAWGCFRDFS